MVVLQSRGQDFILVKILWSQDLRDSKYILLFLYENVVYEMKTRNNTKYMLKANTEKILYMKKLLNEGK